MHLGEIIKGLKYETGSRARLELMEELYWTEYGNFSEEKDLDVLAEMLLRSESVEEHAALFKSFILTRRELCSTFTRISL